MVKNDKYSIDQLHRLPHNPEIDLDKVLVPPFEKDPIFDKLLNAALQRGANVTLTRIATDRIRAGHYVKRGSGWHHVRNFKEAKDRSFLESLIQSGRRPPVYIYPSPCPDNEDFVCPDDENLVDAYLSLGIRKVPAILLARGEAKLGEAKATAKLILMRTTFRFAFVSIDPPDNASVETFFGIDLPTDSLDAFQKLADKILTLSTHVRRFHKAFEEPIHYHHTIYSVLCRLNKHVSGIKLLLEQRLYLEAQFLLRAMYELALNFYLDWLMPEIFGPMLQYSSAFSKKDYLKLRQETYIGWRKQHHLNTNAIKTLSASDERLYDLATKVVEKARINPLGPRHNDLYDALSRAAHEDFMITTEFAHLLETQEADERDPEMDAFILRNAELIVAQIVSCAGDDCNY